MKKIILAIIVLIVAGLGVGPYFVGSQVESLVNKNMEETNALLAQQLKANVFKVNYQITAYNKGYLSSNFDSQLVVSIPNEDDVIIPFKNTVKHGPLVFDGFYFGTAVIDSHLDAAKISAEKPEFITDDFVTSVSKIDFAGNYDSDVKIKAFNYSEDEKNADFKGIDANFKGSLKDVNSYALVMTFNGVDITDNGQVSFAPFTLTGSRSKDGNINFASDKISVSGDTPEGVGTFSIDSMNASGTQVWSDTLSAYTGKVDASINNVSIDASNVQLIFDKIDISSNVEETGNDNFKFAYALTLVPNKDNIKALSAQSPFPITPESISLSVEIGNLPNTLIKDYAELITIAQQGTDEDAFQQKFKDTVLSVLNNGVSAKKNFVFKAEEGSASIDADVKMLDNLGLTADKVEELAISQSASAILALIQGTINVSLDEALASASGADMFIGMYGNGLIQQNPQTNAYEAEIVTKDGVLTVNGQEIPLP